MRNLLKRIACGVALGAALVGAAAAQSRPTRGIELFAGPNFTGESRYFPQGEWNLADRGFNDRAVSVRIYGSGVAWQLCDSSGYTGRCVYVNRDEPDLNRLGMAGRTSSFRTADEAVGASTGATSTAPPRQPGLTLYDQEGFRGRRVNLREDTANLGWNQFNDAARSLQAEGRWQLCTDAYFAGRCQEIQGDVASLASLGLAGGISSVRRVGPGGQSSYRPSPSNVTETTTFDQVDPPQAIGRTSAFFPRPRADGRPIQASRGNEQRVADAFCAAAGLREARYYAIGQAPGSNNPLEEILCVR